MIHFGVGFPDGSIFSGGRDLAKIKLPKKKITSFDLPPGRTLAGKYRVVDQLGSGWESEVYKVREINTGIERAAKLFFPHRNLNNKTARFFARKLHKLRTCSVLIQYHTEERITFKRWPVTVLISEYVEGELLSHFLKKFPGKRLPPFQAVHLLYALTKGIEEIHRLREYHGDLHTDNIIVNRFGLTFELKLVDLFHWSAPKTENMQDDICGAIHVFYESLGGKKYYARQPKTVKKICLGLKRTLILKKFRTSSDLRKSL
ncbi:MAG: protein kinase, partial [Nitrospinaceae bacterium]|nr:protein kinase [Nitrospinaceae bacterium]NIR55088.1 protein kinase [Nitrospinaceae bacterium]NIS85497.1 protein kinase [Nitrospinaceae bacterium]NIT82340.1 protein kinase [Nitrospinaceae bacterium]NIU44553.1 protein kinase [Nitrospinaceae bacterium]